MRIIEPKLAEIEMQMQFYAKIVVLILYTSVIVDVQNKYLLHKQFFYFFESSTDSLPDIVYGYITQRCNLFIGFLLYIS